MVSLKEKIARREKQGKKIGETCIRILCTDIDEAYGRFLCFNPPSCGRRELKYSLSSKVLIHLDAVSGAGKGRFLPDTARSCSIFYNGREVFSATLPNLYINCYKPGDWERIFNCRSKKFMRDDEAEQKRKLKEMDISFKRMDEKRARELGIPID